MNKQSRLTLFELNQLVRHTLERAMPGEYWVEAELSELRERGGHCYMDLVEKDEQGNTPVARASARCWRSTWAMVRPCFERATGQRLVAGMKVLLRVYAQFHEAYGFSWIVTDIDPDYTLGDMARKRREILDTLRREGVIDLNRSLPLPLFCQRIAVISSNTAAGYGDFCRQLADNEHGFRFKATLFAAIMQGEMVERSIIAALDQIAAVEEQYDCVVIIRGGGAVSDMSGFDSLALAENVANFPLPVITGIGHDRDECVLDYVAHTRVKTPTAAAAFLIAHLKEVSDRIDEAERRILVSVRAKQERERMRVARLSDRLTSLFSLVRTRQEARLDRLSERMRSALQLKLRKEDYRLSALTQQLPMQALRLLERERHRLDLLSQRTEAQDPQHILRRGYSITLKDGHAVRQASTLQAGETLETRLAEGSIRSVVTE